MADPIDITLGGTAYKVPPLNIGQIRKIANVVSKVDGAEAGFQILEIAVSRAEPKVENLDAIEGATLDEITAAAQKIMAASGFRPPETATGPAPGAAT